MRKYQVNLTDVNGTTSAIDTIIAQDGYTAEQYVTDCNSNADSDWCEMLNNGDVELVDITEN